MPLFRIRDWPPYTAADNNRREPVVQAAKMMATAAMTAPKAGGATQIECDVVWGEEEQECLAKKLEEMAHGNPSNPTWKNRLKTEAVMVRESDAVVLIGDYLAGDSPFDTMCGMCGGADGCKYVYDRKPVKYGMIDLTEQTGVDTLVNGPLCCWRVNDLGYAVGSALWTAKTLLVDARPFMTVGVAAKKLGYCPRSEIVVAVPVSGAQKNPMVDVPPDYHLLNFTKMVDNMRKIYTITRMIYWYDYKNWYPGTPAKTEKPREVKGNAGD